MKSARIYGLLLLVLGGISCSMKPKSWWREPVVAVMADSTDWGAVQGKIRSNLERIIRTPQIEKTLSVTYVTDEEFVNYSRFRYLLLVATLESTGRVGKLVRNMVSEPEVRRLVETGKTTLFTQKNPWAKDQLMGVIVGKDLEALQYAIEENSHYLYNMFYLDFDEVLEKDMFNRGEQKEEENHLMTAYGWNIRIQRDYFKVQELPAEGFVWYRRMLPERWIFVRWIEGGDSLMLTAPWVVAERNRIGALYYRGDKLSGDYLFSQSGTFLQRPAQITSGLWENDQENKGGPFKNYTFYDPNSQRIYMIDLAVHAPGRNKAPYMRRMEVIARSFTSIFDSQEGND
jgi:hypothetical protein